MSHKNRFQAKEKKVHKMTRDGLVEQNLATGEEQRISQRGQDFNLQQGQTPRQNTAGDKTTAPASNHARQRPQSEPPNRIEAPTQGDTQTPDFRQDSQDATLQSPGQPQNLQQDAQAPARDTISPSRYESHPGAPQNPPPHKQNRRHTPQSQNVTDTAHQFNDNAPQTVQPEVGQPYPMPENEQNEPPNATRQSYETRPGETPSNPISSRYRAKKPANTHHDATDAAAYERSGRLRFSEKQQQTPTGMKPRQKGTKYQQKFATDTTKPENVPVSGDIRPNQAAPDASKLGPPPVQDVSQSSKSGKLHFAKDEKPPDTPTDKKLFKLGQKAARADAKLEKARDKLPAKKKARRQLVYDEQKGKVKHKIQFEKEILPPGSQKPLTPAPVAAVQKGTGGIARVGTNKLHQKVSEVEHENVGVEAAHKTERAVESLYHGGKKVTHSAYSFVRNRPYRVAAKLEKRAVKANIKFDYRRALAENPQLKSNLMSRFMQKQKIKRQYAKVAREAKKAGQAAQKTGNVISNITKAVAGFVRRHPMIACIVALILFILFFFGTMFTSCSNMAGGGFSSIIASSYTAEDADIDNAELSYTEWETDLQMRVNSAEADNPGYDEYKYNVGDISHDPYELMAFLTAMYQDFQYANVQGELQQIFNEQYQLALVPEVEIRTRTVTVTDPETGEESEEEEYEWHILNINLTARSFTDVISPRMNTEQREMFELYMVSKGNRQYFSNPFDFNWLPYVSSYYGYRVHPISGAKDYHKGIDIAVPTGTDIHTGYDGKVTAAAFDAGGYGYYVVIQDDKGLVSKYAHCDSVLVTVGQEVKKGDVIAKSGNTGNSTGPHLHLEVIKNGQYLNPIYFAETGDDGSGRIPPGSPGGVEDPDYPGAPLGDGSYAAMIAEAEKHLGKKYVFGASGPANFDCSGFICWVLDKSGVKPMGRTNAQGLYNMSTPVSPANAQPGDLIFFTGTYSTSNACSHVGIYVGNGMMLHCGDPIQYTSINSSYWQKHFYAFARVN